MAQSLFCSSKNQYENSIFKFKAHSTNLSRKLQTFYEQEYFFDIILIADTDKVQVPAHRIVLSTSSDYFFAMFRSGLKEAKAAEVIIKDIDGLNLKTLVNFMYTGSINLSCENIEIIIQAANFFQMNTLVTACCKFMDERLDTSNCLGIAIFAEHHDYTELQYNSTQFALRNFAQVCTESEFFQLNKDQINKLISSDDLYVECEETVFQSIVAWVEHDKANREDCMLSLLSLVRFTSLDPKFIIENRHSVCKTIESYELICCWLQWHLSPEKRKETILNNTKSRTVRNKTLAFISGAHSRDLQLQTFDSDANTWSYKRIPELQVYKTEYRITYINQKLIITGGEILEFKTNTVECFDFLTNKWINFPPMISARSRHSATEFNGDLCVVGGCGADNCSAEKYDFTTNKWQRLAPLNQNIDRLVLTVLRGSLIAISDGTSEMFSYDAIADSWSPEKSRIIPVSDFGCAELYGKLYVIGGYKDDKECNSVQCYNSFCSNWILRKTLDSCRSNVYCTVLNEKVVIAGGDGPNVFEYLVEKYDPKKNEWKKLAPLLHHTSSLSSDLLFTM